MLETNTQEAIQFISALTGTISDDFPLGHLCVQTFADDRSKETRLARQFFCPTLGSFKQIIPELTELNNQGAGIFAAINSTDGKGRTVQDITGVRSLAVDLDGAPLKNIQNIPLVPHIVVESSENKYHAYWKTDNVPLSLFMPFQQHLAKLTGGDPSICDLARVLRVPGFWHQKDASRPFLTRLLKPTVGMQVETSYSLDTMMLATKISVAQLIGGQNEILSKEDIPQLDDAKAKEICTRLSNRRAEMTKVTSNSQKSRNQNAVYLGFELKAAGVPRQLAGTLGVKLYLENARGTNSKGEKEPLAEDEICRAINNAYLPNKVQLAQRPLKWKTVEELIEVMNQHFMIVEQPFGIFQETTDGDLTSYRLSDFGALLRPEAVFDEKKNKVLQADQVWLASKKRRTYSKIVMVPPPLVAPERSYNLWKGFSVQPVKGECKRFMAHLQEVICGGDTGRFKFFWGWWCQAVQQPGKKPGTTLVLRGLPGSGKGAALDNLGKLFGRHYLHLTHHDSLTKNFNAQLQNKLLVFADEMTWGGNRKDSGTLKGLITEDVISIEPKYRDAYNVDNHLRLVIASNEAWAVPVGLQDRRFFVLDVTGARRGNAEYFKRLFDELGQGGREALLYSLLNTPIPSDLDLRKPPLTTAKEELAFNSMRGVEAFLVDLFSSRSLLFDNLTTEYVDDRKIKGDWLKEEALVAGISQHESYTVWCRNHHEQPVNSRSFQLRLKYLIPDVDTGYIQYHTADGKHHIIKATKYPKFETAARQFCAKVGLSYESLIDSIKDEPDQEVDSSLAQNDHNYPM